MAEIDSRVMRARTWRHWYEDGLPELFGGTLLLVYGAFQLAPAPAQRYLLGIVIPILGVGYAFGARPLMIRLKERLSFPRTGYAVPRRPSGKWLALAFVLVGLAILLFAWTGDLLTATGWRDPEATLIAIAVSGAWLGTGVWYGVRRLIWFGIWALALGFALPLAGVAPPLRLGLFMLGTGAAAVLSGAVALRTLLRTGTPPEA